MISANSRAYLSLDADGHRMIDDAGNSGMQSKYDEKGYDIEDTSVNTDLKPRPVKDGWVINKNQYDGLGRLCRTTYHDVNGEPVLSKKDGYHGWQSNYDEHGNRTVVTYLGLDGKPILVADGYATFKSSYDSRGNKTRQTYYGVNDEPILSKESGCHGWQAEYRRAGPADCCDVSGFGREADTRCRRLCDIQVELRFTRQ